MAVCKADVVRGSYALNAASPEEVPKVSPHKRIRASVKRVSLANGQLDGWMRELQSSSWELAAGCWVLGGSVVVLYHPNGGGSLSRAVDQGEGQERRSRAGNYSPRSDEGGQTKTDGRTNLAVL